MPYVHDTSFYFSTICIVWGEAFASWSFKVKVIRAILNVKLHNVRKSSDFGTYLSQRASKNKSFKIPVYKHRHDRVLCVRLLSNHISFHALEGNKYGLNSQIHRRSNIVSLLFSY